MTATPTLTVTSTATATVTTAAGDCTVNSSELPPSQEEQNLLNTINRYRTVPYTWSDTLSRAAVWQAHDMADHNYLGDVDTLGRDVRQRTTDCGYDPAAPVGEDSTTLGEMIEDKHERGLGSDMAASQRDAHVSDLVSQLPYRERLILELRYGLAGNRPHTLEEVGRRFGVTRERVRQIETRTLRRLAAAGENAELRLLID